MPQTVAIVNPYAGSAHLRESVEAALNVHFRDAELRETAQQGDAARLAAEAIHEGAETILACGGDGTVHAVLAGMAEAGRFARLGVVPMGTGNDLARTLELPFDAPADAVAVLGGGLTTTLDLFRATDEQGERWGINASAGGFSGRVDEAITPEMKRRWGPLAYLAAAANSLPDLTPKPTRLWLDDEEPIDLEAFNVIVANGCTVAGGHCVAPRAKPDDGWLDVIVAVAAPAPTLLAAAAGLLAGRDVMDSPAVFFRRARRVRLRVAEGMRFNIDGELWSEAPHSFEIVPEALPVLVGPQYGLV